MEKLNFAGRKTFFKVIEEYEKPLTLKTLEEMAIRNFF